MDGGYLNIPDGLRYNSNFSTDEKFVLAEIIALSKMPKGCFASDSHFALLINKSRQSTNQIIKRLQRKGYLDLEVKPGIGKKTKLTEVFWNLLREPPIKSPDTQGPTKIEEGVELLDNSCQETGQVGVWNSDTTCRDLDTINTINNTSLILQEELQYTGEKEISLVDNNDKIGERVIELMCISPAQLLNPFLIKFQDCLFELDAKFGPELIFDYQIFKSNKELYEIYGFDNFSDVRQHLIFVKENMDKFLRYKRFK